jgi:hypothetical protein
MSDTVGGRLDAVVAKIDFGLAAVMGYMHVHGEQDFAAEETSVG